MDIYLSRVALNTKRENTISALSSPQRIHAAVESSFPPDTKKKGRNLWRIDQLGSTVYLLVLSHMKPDFLHIIEQFGWPSSDQRWETKDYKPLLERIEVGQRWQFRLRANPVHSVKSEDSEEAQKSNIRGKLYGHVTVKQQEKWLSDRASKYGFRVKEDSFCVTQQEVRKFRRSNSQVTLNIATYEGILEVADTRLFKEALIQGIGRAKAYGCGLLTVTKVLS